MGKEYWERALSQAQQHHERKQSIQQDVHGENQNTFERVKVKVPPKPAINKNKGTQRRLSIRSICPKLRKTRVRATSVVEEEEGSNTPNKNVCVVFDDPPRSMRTTFWVKLASCQQELPCDGVACTPFSLLKNRLRAPSDVFVCGAIVSVSVGGLAVCRVCQPAFSQYRACESVDVCGPVEQ